MMGDGRRMNAGGPERPEKEIEADRDKGEQLSSKTVDRHSKEDKWV